MFATFQIRRGTAAAWTSANPTLADGEMALESDTRKFKVGDGATSWSSLAYGGIKGDTGAAGTAGNALAQVTLDFGTNPVGSMAFSFADAAATTASKIMMVMAPDSDEYEMDGFTCGAYCAANGTVTAFINANPGPVTGPRKFNYYLG